MKRKVLLCLLSIVLVIGCITGCGDSKNDSKKPQEPAWLKDARNPEVYSLTHYYRGFMLSNEQDRLAGNDIDEFYKDVSELAKDNLFAKEIINRFDYERYKNYSKEDQLFLRGVASFIFYEIPFDKYISNLDLETISSFKKVHLWQCTENCTFSTLSLNIEYEEEIIDWAEGSYFKITQLGEKNNIQVSYVKVNIGSNDQLLDVKHLKSIIKENKEYLDLLIDYRNLVYREKRMVDILKMLPPSKGMSMVEVEGSKWGRPNSTRADGVIGNSIYITWIYDRYGKVYFKDGYVYEIENK